MKDVACTLDCITFRREHKVYAHYSVLCMTCGKSRPYHNEDQSTYGPKYLDREQGFSILHGRPST